MTKSDNGGASDRDARLAARLRDNLRRRKEQARQRADNADQAEPPSATDGTPPADETA